MANNKHNKIKNVGVLFELLTRQITSDTINGIDNSPAIRLVKEYFNKNSCLLKELNMYKALQQQKYNTQVKVDRFIDLVITEHSKLPQSKLKREKYGLIKEIKNIYSLENFLKSHVSNYKLNASIYNILEYKNSKQAKNPAIIMKSRSLINEHIIDNKVNKPKSDKLINEYSKQDKDLRLLSYKILLEKFNSKYGSLSLKQKSLLKEYINNISNTSKLKTYIIKEINNVTKALDLLKLKVTNNVVKIKLDEVSQQIKLIKKDTKVRDKHLVSLLRSYSLVSELRNVTK
tara:strand:- start:1180 stop:2043 length:864 start_codon:yes stop_codon:yes gene_type:complete